MARRNRIPMAGNRAVNAVRLKPAVKARLKRQATRQARRTYRPERKALRAQKAGVRKTYQKQMNSAAGAVDLLQQSLNSIGTQGLSGQNKRMLQQEIKGSQIDAANALPYLTADARQAKVEGLSDIRSQIAQSRADQAKAAQSEYASEYDKSITQAISSVKEREANRKDKREDVSDRKDEKREDARERALETRNAIKEGRRLMEAYPGQTPSNEKEWARFTDAIAGAEGIGLAAARRATRKLQEDMIAPAFKGLLSGGESIGRGLRR